MRPKRNRSCDKWVKSDDRWSASGCDVLFYHSCSRSPNDNKGALSGDTAVYCLVAEDSTTTARVSN